MGMENATCTHQVATKTTALRSETQGLLRQPQNPVEDRGMRAKKGVRVLSSGTH